jgi:Domain of unknown function (DUF4375)
MLSKFTNDPAVNHMDKNAILIDLSESEKTKLGREDFWTQTIPQRIFSAVWSVESEVNNGGFSQYFLNTSCETAAFVGPALDTIGAAGTADICRRAIEAAFPAGLPSSPTDVSVAASEFSDETLNHLETLDAEFFKYPDNLTDLLFAFASKHPEEFGELPRPDESYPVWEVNE